MLAKEKTHACWFGTVRPLIGIIIGSMFLLFSIWQVSEPHIYDIVALQCCDQQGQKTFTFLL
jgi:hypothetical protein